MGKFQYIPRDNGAVKARQNQTGSSWDRWAKDGIPLFKAKEGDNRIRILPPTWDNPTHFGFDVWFHRNIGTGGKQCFVCPLKMNGSPCPICEEEALATRAGKKEYAYQLRATKRVVVFLIDRDKSAQGPTLWDMPWKVDRDIANISVDKTTHEVLAVDNPEQGYDIDFVRTGMQITTTYSGLQVSRRASPLGSGAEADAWLDFIVKNPIPSLIIIKDYDYLKKVFDGQAAPEDEAEELPPVRKPVSRAERSAAPVVVPTAEDDLDAPPVRSRTRENAEETRQELPPEPVTEQDAYEEDAFVAAADAAREAVPEPAVPKPAPARRLVPGTVSAPVASNPAPAPAAAPAAPRRIIRATPVWAPGSGIQPVAPVPAISKAPRNRVVEEPEEETPF